MSSWTKEYVMNMKTHEASDGNNTTTVDFCLDYNNNLYWSMHDCYSTTYPNYTAFQAWRAGFREGVKMCLVNGITPSVDEFKRSVPGRNFDNLTIWHNVGMDVENGDWAMYGARYGTYMVMLNDWDPKQVQWFDNVTTMWDLVKDHNPTASAHQIGNDLHNKLGLPMLSMNADQSRFFKRHYNKDKHNKGPLIREMDVIRKQEGW